MAEEATSKTTVIICPGPWQTEAHVQPCIPYFQKAGYHVIAQPLLSAGKAVDFEDDVVAIKETLDSELSEGRDVCLVLHSASAVFGCEAVNRVLECSWRLKGKLLWIIFVAAFVQWEEVMGDMAEKGYMDTDDESGMCYHVNSWEAFYNDITPKEAAPFIEALAPQSLMEQPEFSSGRWEREPLTYVLCTEDNSVPLKVQESIAGDYSMETVRMKAGHCPFTTQPQKFVEVVDDILKD